MTDTVKASRREVTLPAATLVGLLARVEDADDSALREHGRAAGRLLADRLLSPQDDAPSARALPPSLFWKRVGELFASRGWGTLTHRPAGDVGELRASDWVEAERTGNAGTCSFAVGAIQGLLEAVSGSRLEVEEIDCRATGGAACRFLFGSATAIAATRDAERVGVSGS